MEWGETEGSRLPVYRPCTDGVLDVGLVRVLGDGALQETGEGKEDRRGALTQERETYLPTLSSCHSSSVCVPTLKQL